MARRDPSKAGLAGLEPYREAFEAGAVTSAEIADALGISVQKLNAAIKRKSWSRPGTPKGGPTEVKGVVTTFTSADAGDALVSFAMATLGRAHTLVSGGDLGPSALKAVAAAAEAAEGILQRRGIICHADSAPQLEKLEIAVLSQEEEAKIREIAEAAAGDLREA
jgi:hypothetical protein